MHFNVKCDRTRIGDRVALVGNIEELGEWNPKNARFLDTSANSFPNWHICLRVPQNIIIEYKYIIA